MHRLLLRTLKFSSAILVNVFLSKIALATPTSVVQPNAVSQSGSSLAQKQTTQDSAVVDRVDVIASRTSAVPEPVRSLDEIQQTTHNSAPKQVDSIASRTATPELVRSLDEIQQTTHNSAPKQVDSIASQTGATPKPVRSFNEVQKTTGNSAPPNPSVDQNTDENQDPMDQVTSVSQLTDVRPTDWAFQALQSLVERYGCIAGYPDKTYRGNRALTRYEFAAGLNACLNRVNELIAAATSDLVRKEDIANLQRLQEEFGPELASLRGRVDVLEARTAQLEANQFSTTTKLNVEAITYFGDAFGNNAGKINNADFGYRVRMNLNTSFTGKDRLRARLQATDLRLFDTGATFGSATPTNLQNSETAGQSGETRLVASSQGQSGQVNLNYLEYRFPVGNSLNVYLEGSVSDPTYVADPISPFVDTSTTGISNFGQVNPFYFPIGTGGGLQFDYALTKFFTVDGGYLLEENNDVGSHNLPGRSSGVGSGSYQAWSQFTLSTKRLKLAFFYSNAYSARYGMNTLTGSVGSQFNVTVPDPTASTGARGGPVVGNTYNLEANYQFSDRFQLGGWLGYLTARSLGVGVKGDGSVYNFAVTAAFPDLGAKGNLGGLVFGVQPKLTGTSNNVLAAAIGEPVENGVQRRRDRNTGFHIEGFYRIQVNDNISITPAAFVLTAPNHDSRNPATVVGIIRTTFIF